MIREATRTFDFMGIYQVTKACEDRPYFIHHPILLRFFQKLKGRVYFVYILEQEVVGFVAADNNFVGDLKVMPKHRGNGIGTELRLRIEKHILAKHNRMIILAPKHCLDFYLTNGYKVIGTKRFTKDIEMFKEVIQ